jgi:hypothetical protein
MHFSDKEDGLLALTGFAVRQVTGRRDESR